MSTAILPVKKRSPFNEAVAGNLSVKMFEGTTDELQQFIQNCWQSAYLGKMTFPLWTRDYLDWQVPSEPKESSRRLAVYNGNQLAGVLLGTPYDFRHQSPNIAGSHWSWLSVSPEFQGRGISKLLDKQRVQTERNLDSELIVSYRFTGSRHSLAERPSKKFPLKDFNRKIGFWARPLDTKRLSQWNPNRLEGISSRFVSPILPKTVPIQTNGNIRKFLSEDFERCADILKSRVDRFELSIDWDESSLRRHLLGSELSQTIVAENNGRIEGLINFHVLNFQGRTVEPVGIIDIIADENLPSQLSQAMISAALDEMKSQGVILALKLKSGDSKSFALLRNGFLPRLPDSSLVFQWTQSRREIDSRRSLHILWR